ncbi:hypothetical protein OAN96_01100 [Candidatus Gracilibacteria bacterium]|nr:hypothetical protein [Candidatus Gracilibacteria bacterium]
MGGGKMFLKKSTVKTVSWFAKLVSLLLLVVAYVAEFHPSSAEFGLAERNPALTICLVLIAVLSLVVSLLASGATEVTIPEELPDDPEDVREEVSRLNPTSSRRSAGWSMICLLLSLGSTVYFGGFRGEEAEVAILFCVTSFALAFLERSIFVDQVFDKGTAGYVFMGMLMDKFIPEPMDEENIE